MSLITHLRVNQNLLVYIFNDAMTSGKKLTGYSEYSGVERKMGFLLRTTAHLRKGDNKRGESIILTGILPKIKVRWKLPKMQRKPPFLSKRTVVCGSVNLSVLPSPWKDGIFIWAQFAHP